MGAAATSPATGVGVAAGVGVGSALPTHGCAQQLTGGRGIVRCLASYGQLEVDIDLFHLGGGRHQLVAVGLQHPGIAGQAVEPGQLGKKGGIVEDQVVLEVAEEVEVVQVPGQDGVAFKAEQAGFTCGGVVLEQAGRQWQLVQQVASLGRADDDLQVDAAGLVDRRGRKAIALAEPPFLRAGEGRVQGAQACSQGLDARLGVAGE